MFTHHSRKNRLAGTACVLMLLAGGLVGCHGPQTRRDAFQEGANRPPTPRTLHMMARLLNENGRSDQAEYVLLKIIEQNPNYLPGYVDLADLQIRQQRFTEAVETLGIAHGIAPNDAVIANNLGVLQLRDRNFEQASEAFHAAVMADGGEARYRANYALSLGMEGRYREAFEAYTSVVNTSEAYWNVGVIAEARKDKTQAASFFDQSHRVAKANDDVDADTFWAQATGSTPTTDGPTGFDATASVPVE
ncbi:MAG: tetratricopeptide repeat protein [Phycisphaeraceae bacterium]|nr:MAG: tetratricopeptide repeat protein [Phycisphaeraceae bacterium]